jgi:hypothetical protein
MKEWKYSVHITSQIPHNEARSSSLLNREGCESEKSICLGFNAPSVEKALRVLSELSGGSSPSEEVTITRREFALAQILERSACG